MIKFSPTRCHANLLSNCWVDLNNDCTVVAPSYSKLPTTTRQFFFSIIQLHNNTKQARLHGHHWKGGLQNHRFTHSSHSVIEGEKNAGKKKNQCLIARGEGMCQCAIPVIMWVSRALIIKTHPMLLELSECWAWLCIKLHQKLLGKCLKSPAL